MPERLTMEDAGQPGDIASVAVFLASADSGWITGEQLLASGGVR
jgi:3-oxoacyl-[acyl-carrier protein] reductase